MTLKEFYTKTEADYDKVIRRLVSEKMALKYIKKFPDDCHFKQLRNAILEEDFETAYRAVHTLKGLCLSLGFITLSKPVIALTEELRAGITKNAKSYFLLIEKEYTAIINMIDSLSC